MATGHGLVVSGFCDPGTVAGAGCDGTPERGADRCRRAVGSIAVSEIAEQLHVAPETVRRDFKTLQEHGLIRRTHGGAHPVDGAAFETSVSRSSEYLLAEKRRIAVAAATTLDDAATLYLDEGFTPSLVADELIKLKSRLTVVTSSLALALAVAGNWHRQSRCR